jgi:iron complex outermembrane receptor protein
MGDLEQRRSARCLFSGTVLAALLCVCTPRSAFAAEAAGAPANEEIQEIVVTAQHRVQSLQEVPISVTVLSGDTILESHLRDFSDLSLQTPSFTSGADYGYIRNSSMRGISNNQYGFADDPSIAMFVDDVYQGRGATGMQVNALYDIDRVEVIKGPQATLFGRSSIAGAISTILVQPSDTFSASGNFGAGQRNRLIAEGAVNFPVTPNLAIRVALDREKQRGFISNLNGGPKLDPLDVEAGRVIVRYTGIDDLEATLKASYESRRQDGSTHLAVGLPNATDFTADETLIGPQNYADFYSYEEVGKLKYDFLKNLSVTSETSWRRVKNNYVEKYDGLAEVVAGPYAQDSLDSLFQQELRISFSGDNGLAIIGGVSYFHETIHAFVGNWVDHTFELTGIPTPGLLPNDYSQAEFEQGRYDGVFRGRSAFLDGTIGIPGVKGWTVTAGARYNYDEKTYTENVPNPTTLSMNAGKPFFVGAFYNWGYWTDPALSTTHSWSNTSFRGATNYDLNQDNTVYFQYSQGWKAGGIDSYGVVVRPGSAFAKFFGENVTAFGGTQKVYDPERSDSYEIGLKGRSFERRFAYNLAVYEYLYRDLQVGVLQASGAGSVVANIGHATGRGVEADLRIAPNAHWDIYANGAFNYTRIEDFGTMSSQVGLPLNQAPRYNAAAGATYKWTANSGKYSVGASTSLRGSYRDDNDLDTHEVRSYILYNTRAAYETLDGHYTVAVFADNVFNRFTYSRYSAVTPFIYPVASYQVIGHPRTVGVDVYVRF